MDLDTQIIAVFCRIDDTLQRVLQGQSLRQRGPQPALSDAEVLTMEAVGEFLGFSRDTAIYRYFRQHYRHFFPALARVSRTTFARQVENAPPACGQPLAGQGAGLASSAGCHPT